MDFCIRVLELKDLIEIVLSQAREISFLLHQFKCLGRVFVNYQDHALFLVGFFVCLFLFFLFFEKNFPVLGTFQLRAQVLLRKIFFYMSLFKLSGDEESRKKALSKTCVGQCVLMNIDFGNAWYLG